MAIVTFLSDFGEEDHYVAAVKASILTVNPDCRIIDISHKITPFDIGHASYVLRNAFSHFPKGTIHLVGLDPANEPNKDGLIAELEDHLFVGMDNGLLSLISDKPATRVIRLNTMTSSFLTRELLGPVCGKLSQGTDPSALGDVAEDHKRLFNRTPKVTKREIVGTIIRIDHYGNLITNILKTDFDKIQEINGQVPFQIQFGRERYQKFHSNYADAEPGDCYVLFNSQGVLQIGINKGNASQLLGLRAEAPVFIEFKV